MMVVFSSPKKVIFRKKSVKNSPVISRRCWKAKMISMSMDSPPVTEFNLPCFSFPSEVLAMERSKNFFSVF